MGLSCKDHLVQPFSDAASDFAPDPKAALFLFDPNNPDHRQWLLDQRNQGSTIHGLAEIPSIKNLSLSFLDPEVAHALKCFCARMQGWMFLAVEYSDALSALNRAEVLAVLELRDPTGMPRQISRQTMAALGLGMYIPEQFDFVK